MSDQVADVLDKAADLLTPEGAWTQRAASNAAGEPLRALDPTATCWCMWGAIARVIGLEDASNRFVTAAGKVLPGSPSTALMIGRWNDKPERTQAEVVAALRTAATLARKDAN